MQSRSAASLPTVRVSHLHVASHGLAGIDVLMFRWQVCVKVMTGRQMSRQATGTSSWSTFCARPVAERTKARARAWKCMVPNWVCLEVQSYYQADLVVVIVIVVVGSKVVFRS